MDATFLEQLTEAARVVAAMRKGQGVDRERLYGTRLTKISSNWHSGEFVMLYL